MKKTLLSLATFTFLLTSTAHAYKDDAKELYQALKVTPVAGVEERTQYPYSIKSVPGFISCKEWDFFGTGKAYHCSYGTLDGYSMADEAYDSLDVPEHLVMYGIRGKTYRKSAGNVTCTKVVYYRTKMEGDMGFHQSSQCKVKIKFSNRR